MSRAARAEVMLFGQVPIFRGLSEEQLARLVAVAKPGVRQAGEVIIREGEEGDSLFILADGAVEITKTMTLIAKQNLSNVEKTLMRLDGREPAFFGEMGMLEKAERSATVTAASPCHLFEIGRADFERLAEEDPQLGYRVLRNVAAIVCGRLRKANKDVLKLATALSIALGNR